MQTTYGDGDDISEPWGDVCLPVVVVTPSDHSTVSFEGNGMCVSTADSDNVGQAWWDLRLAIELLPAPGDDRAV